jgi:hypothetical protein
MGVKYEEWIRQAASIDYNYIKSMFEAPGWVGAKGHGVATTPLLRELRIAPIESTATMVRTRAFLAAPTLNTC